MKKLTFILLAFCHVSFAQTVKDAMRLNDNEQYDAASEIYKQLIAKEPNNANVYYAFGENYIDAGNTDSAKVVFTRGLQADGNNVLNKIGLAKVKIANGQLAEGKADIETVVTLTKSKDANVLLEAGEALYQFKSKDLMSAQSYLETAVKLDAKNVNIYNALGDVYSELNNGTMAAANYNKALDIDKNNPKALLHKGQLYKRSTNYEGAAAEFAKALAVDANFAPAYRELGEVYYLQRKLDKAKENYKKYLELSKNNNNARLRYASFLFYSKNYEEALEQLKQITPFDSSNVGLTRLSAYINHETGDTLGAESMVNRLWDITAADTSKRINLDYEYYGKILAAAGNDSLGGIYMWQAYHIDPSKTDMLNEIAQMFTKSRRHDEAAKAYEEKIRTGKNVTTTDYFNLGKAYYFNKEYGKADTAFAKVTELQPAYAYGHFWRGRANSQMDPEGKEGLARPFFEKYIEEVQKDTASVTKYRKDLIEAYGTIALYHYQKKEYDQANAFCQKVFELDPENQNARVIVANIKAIKEGNQKKEPKP